MLGALFWRHIVCTFYNLHSQHFNTISLKVKYLFLLLVKKNLPHRKENVFKIWFPFLSLHCWIRTEGPLGILSTKYHWHYGYVHPHTLLITRRYQSQYILNVLWSSDFIWLKYWGVLPGNTFGDNKQTNIRQTDTTQI